MYTRTLCDLCEINQCPCTKLHVNKDVGFRLLTLFRFDLVLIENTVNKQKHKKKKKKNISHLLSVKWISSHTCRAHCHFSLFHCQLQRETTELLRKTRILKMAGIEEDVIYAFIFKVQKVDIYSCRRRCLPFTPRTCHGLHMGVFYFRTWSVWRFGWLVAMWSLCAHAVGHWRRRRRWWTRWCDGRRHSMFAFCMYRSNQSTRKTSFMNFRRENFNSMLAYMLARLLLNVVQKYRTKTTTNVEGA